MVKGILKSSPREEIQRYYQGKFLSMVGSKGMFFSQKRMCCATGSYTRHWRFWHVFKWAEWYSWGKFGSSATWIFCWDSAFCRVSADIFSYWGGGLGRGILLRQGSSSGSDSGSGSELSDENEPFLESPAGPKVPSERPPDLPSQEDLSVDQRAQVNPELISLNLSQLIL